MSHDSQEQYEAAQAEARLRGMAFVVNGLHVPAENVFILSVPDTIGPISAMRTAKDEAKKALPELTMTLKVDADVATLKALDGCIALLRGCYEALASNHGIVRSETRLAIGKFLEQMAERYVPADPASEKIDLPSHTPVGIALPDNSKSCSNKACLAGVVIDGIVVTDPELAASITDAAPSVTHVCADCGQPFEAKGNGSIFCPLHAQS